MKRKNLSVTALLSQYTKVSLVGSFLAISACGMTDLTKGNISGSVKVILQDEGPTLVLDVQLGREPTGDSKAEAKTRGTVRPIIDLNASQKEVLEVIELVALERDINLLDFVAVGWIESRLDANARNPRSTASGVFQFIRSTANSYGLDDPFDLEANVRAAANLWLDNGNALIKGLGRKPTGAEMYLAHQQGAGGALRLLKANDSARNEVGEAAVNLNGGRSSISSSEFVNLWADKFEKARAQFTIL